MSPTLLTPIGSTSVDHLASNVNAYIDGTVRLSHTTGATSVAAAARQRTPHPKKP